MDSPKSFLDAHDKFVRALCDTHREFMDSLVALYPAAKDGLEAYHAGYCERQRQLAAAVVLVGEHPQSPIDEILRHYNNHLEKGDKVGKTPARVPKQERALDTRRVIVEAAMSLILRGQPVLTTDICKQLGFSASGTHGYFPTTTQLAEEAYKTLFAPLLDQS